MRSMRSEIRNGFLWEECDGVARIKAIEPFEVDGIVYDRSRQLRQLDDLAENRLRG